MKTISELQPSALWRIFSDICQVPRPSKREGKIIAFLQKFGQIAFDQLPKIIDSVHKGYFADKKEKKHKKDKKDKKDKEEQEEQEEKEEQ